MPTVLHVEGFRIVIYLPPREHEPPHVHVWKGAAEVIIDLATAHRRQTIRAVSRMRTADVTKAFWIVEAHNDYLMKCWRQHHG